MFSLHCAVSRVATRTAAACCLRRALATYTLDGLAPKISDSAWVAPSADVMGNVELHEDASVWFNATIRGDNALITVGRGSNVQDGSVLHSDEGTPLTIGENVTVGERFIHHSRQQTD